MKSTNLFDNFINMAKGSNARIVLPEGEDQRVEQAAEIAVSKKLGKIILLGNVEQIKLKLNKAVQNEIEIIDPLNSKKLSTYAKKLYELRKHKGLTLQDAQAQVKIPMVFATMMLYCGDAEGVVAGARLKTGDVLRPAFQIIKAKQGVSKVSSAMLLEVPENLSIGEKGMLVLADCGVIPEPNDLDLADIAITTAKTAKNLCGINPKVALLCYSTNSIGDSGVESVEKVKRAVKLAKQKCPELIIEGEIQADAAIVPQVAELKCPKSVLKGKANVLIFPDLNSANIAYKLVQRIANVRAVGPLLQGLNKPINDMSRGANADEIVQTIAITILQSKN